MSRRHKKQKKGLKKTFKLSRSIHIYLSSALFALMLFFSFTGFTLNHAQWFSSSSAESVFAADLPVSFEFDFDSPKVDAITQYLKQEHGLDHVRSVDLDPIEQLINLDYSLPNGYAFVSLYLAESRIEVEYTLGSGIGLLNDLHKGRHSGEVWSWVIDLSAWLFCFFSITGFILIFQNKKYRRDALLASLAGMVTPVVVFIFWIPTFSH
ncbi:MAG: hypothetical protein ACI8SR_000171 [Oceanicoccus sp.]|jgi:hypothetical protein